MFALSGASLSLSLDLDLSLVLTFSQGSFVAITGSEASANGSLVVTAANFTVTKDFADGLYDSCANVPMAGASPVNTLFANSEVSAKRIDVNSVGEVMIPKALLNYVGTQNPVEKLVSFSPRSLSYHSLFFSLHGLTSLEGIPAGALGLQLLV
jgi:hypothetical protein